MSSLFDPALGRSAVAAETDDQAFLAGLLQAEGALARACEAAGLIPAGAARAIGAACDSLLTLDPAELGRRAVTGGNPVIPLVAALRERVRESAGPEVSAAVHLGATSQDILDTATMLVVRRATGPLLADLSAGADSAAALAGRHRGTPMTARTLLQPALATTFGALAAGWGAALDRSVSELTAAREGLPAQLAGAAGTLAGYRESWAAVRAAYAAELGLACPTGSWHSDRSVVTSLAGRLGSAAAACGKVATDIVLLSAAEIGELAEESPGGSSAMPHKQNAIAAVTARAGAMQAPGLVATLLAAAGQSELQRAAGAWHAEWRPLVELLRSVGGAAARLRGSLAGLRVDAAAMTRNLRTLAAVTDVADTGAAGDLVAGYLADRGR